MARSHPAPAPAPARTLSVPAHFFTASARKVTFDDDGRAAIRGGPDAPLRIEALELPPGGWQVAYEASRSIAETRLYRGNDMQTVASGATFAQPAGQALDLEIISEREDTLLYGMTLTRTD